MNIYERKCVYCGCLIEEDEGIPTEEGNVCSGGHYIKFQKATGREVDRHVVRMSLVKKEEKKRSLIDIN